MVEHISNHNHCKENKLLWLKKKKAKQTNPFRKDTLKLKNEERFFFF